MKSAGNDIVALNVIDKQRTCRPEFYSKFIIPSELSLFEHHEMPFETFIWLLWSVKESVYKYLKRGDADLVFSPSKIIIKNLTLTYKVDCQWESDQSVDCSYKGSVLYNTSNLHFESINNNDFIASVVNNDEAFTNVYFGVKKNNKFDTESQSKAVRSFLLNKLNSIFPHNQFKIDKNPIGYPVLLNGEEEIDIPVSFSHHNRYVSYSFLSSK